MNKLQLFWTLRKNVKLSEKRNVMFEANQYGKFFGYIAISIFAIEFIALGTFFGWQAVFFALVVGAFLGSFVGILLIVLGKGRLGSRIPFGPYLALGAFVWAFWGAAIVKAYLALLAPPVP